ncbi:PREDICTED: lysoplasmalogenase isoform X2 [Papilio xuthus]|uniref:Lysoplasmalogenase TMEM86B n=1 Tax=Papilio xuthus TaxID=66420 RepID=A0AAJ6ZFJ1_PAPXU|nr:PREDICTED: lysoplasmalogenase isoform X2 [Papilio xuthus]
MLVIRDLMKRAGVSGQLVPFFKAVCVYFLLGAGAPSATTAALKCAPVICLFGCVLYKAAYSAGARGRYARFVCLGLALSALGDAALVWPRLLAVGIVMFGAAHVAYIAAFGLRPRRAGLGALAALAAALYVRTLRPAALAPFAILVHVYAALLAAMAWRGAARPGPQRAGAVLFAISDALLGYSLFGGSLPYKNVLVMSTYYLGQLLIALSALKPAEAQQHEQ